MSFRSALTDVRKLSTSTSSRTSLPSVRYFPADASVEFFFKPAFRRMTFLIFRPTLLPAPLGSFNDDTPERREGSGLEDTPAEDEQNDEDVNPLRS